MTRRLRCGVGLCGVVMLAVAACGIDDEVAESTDRAALTGLTVSGDNAVDTGYPAPAIGTQSKPAIGHSGRIGYEFLAVWQDERRGLDGRRDIYGAHIDRNGTILEPNGFLISDPLDGNDHASPVVYWDAIEASYVVAYIQANTIVARLVSPYGTAPLPGVFTVALQPLSATISNLDMSSDFFAPDAHNRLAFVWQQTSITTGATQLYAATAQLLFPGGSPQFQVLSSSAIGPTNAVFPKIANSNVVWGTRFLVVFQHASDTMGVTLEQTGAASTAFMIHHVVLPENAASLPSVTFTGGEWIVASTLSHISNPSIHDQVIATEVDVSGVVYSTIVVDSTPIDHGPPIVAGHGHTSTGGNEIMIAWPVFVTSSDTIGTIAAGTLVDVAPTHQLAVLQHAQTFTSATNRNDGFPNRMLAIHSDENTSFLTLWEQDLDGNKDIYARRYLFSNSVPPGPALVSGSTNDETPASLAYCGSRYLGVWTTVEALEHRVVGQLFESDGMPVAPPFELGEFLLASHVAVACNGTNYTVAWELDGDYVSSTTPATNILTTLVSQAGVVQTPGGVRVTTAGTNQHPALISAPRTTWLVWDTQDSTGSSIYGQRLDSSNNKVGTPVVIDHPAGLVDTLPDIATDGSSFEVTWQQSTDIYAASVSAAGVVSNKIPVEFNRPPQRSPRIRYTGTSYLIAYEDDSNSSTRGVDIYGRTLTGTTLSASFAIAASPDDDIQPHIATRTAADAEVTYARRSRTSPFLGDIYGQTVTSGATNGAAYAISSGPRIREIAPDAACRSTTSCMTIYQAFDLDGGDNANRLRMRFLDF